MFVERRRSVIAPLISPSVTGILPSQLADQYRNDVVQDVLVASGSNFNVNDLSPRAMTTGRDRESRTVRPVQPIAGRGSEEGKRCGG